MPRVKGFLRIIRRRPGEGGPVDPDWGIEEGTGGEDGIWPGLPDTDPPDPPPGIWPPLTPEHPWRPLPSLPERPSTGPTPPQPHPGQPLPRPPRPTDPDYGIDEGLPPGTIWPPLPPGVHGKYLALVLIGGGGHGAHYRYVVIDADYRPARPDQGLPGEPRPEPK